MNQEHDWQRVVDKLQPQGYCEIQDFEEGEIYHGPVKHIWIDGRGNVHIRLKWVAKKGLPGEITFDKWVRADDRHKEHIFPNHMIPFVVESTPEEGERIRFSNFQVIYLLPNEEIDSQILEEIGDDQLYEVD